MKARGATIKLIWTKAAVIVQTPLLVDFEISVPRKLFSYHSSVLGKIFLIKSVVTGKSEI